jgi:hypothetical protein
MTYRIPCAPIGRERTDKRAASARTSARTSSAGAPPRRGRPPRHACPRDPGRAVNRTPRSPLHRPRTTRSPAGSRPERRTGRRVATSISTSVRRAVHISRSSSTLYAAPLDRQAAVTDPGRSHVDVEQLIEAGRRLIRDFERPHHELVLAEPVRLESQVAVVFQPGVVEVGEVAPVVDDSLGVRVGERDARQRRVLERRVPVGQAAGLEVRHGRIVRRAPRSDRTRGGRGARQADVGARAGVGAQRRFLSAGLIITTPRSLARDRLPARSHVK